MKKKDIIIYCLIILAIFIYTSLAGLKLPVIIIGILGFIFYLWADSKEKQLLSEKISEEVKKKLDEQAIEESNGESKEHSTKK